MGNQATEKRKAKRKNSQARTILYEQRPTCEYCGRSFHVPNDPNLTVDHRVPKCRGGTESVSNKVLCCVECNRRKGERVTFFLFPLHLVKKSRRYRKAL